MADKSSAWRPGPTVCRCCLAEGCYKDISTEYFWMGKREVYADMLADTLSLSIGYSKTGGPNSNSRLICEPCISRLRDATDFKRQVQECEKTFMQYLDPGSSSVMSLMDSDDIQMETIEKDVKIEQVKVEKKYSDDEFDSRDFGDDDDDDDDMDQPLTTFASKEPKKETINLLDLLESPKKKTTKPKLVAKKKIIIKKDVKVKPTTSKAVPKSDDKKRKGPRKKSDALCDTESKPKQKLFERSVNQNPRKQNAVLTLKYSTAFPFKTRFNRIICSYCHDEFEIMATLRDHMKSNHNNADLNSAFYKVDVLKVDITDFKCKICEQAMLDVDTFMAHISRDHGITVNFAVPFGVLPYRQDATGMWTCLKCDKLFPEFAQINGHLRTHVKIYTCDKCGATFLSEHGLKQHERNLKCYKLTYKPRFGKALKHRSNAEIILQCSTATPFRTWGQNFNCVLCRVQSYDPNGLRMHMASRHATYDMDHVFSRKLRKEFLKVDITDLQCKLCFMPIDTLDDLLSHLRNDHKQPINADVQPGVLPYKLNDGSVWKCAICTHQFTDFISLKKHTSEHYQNFVCDTCGEGFITESALLAHTRIPHGNKYSCSRCVATFSTLDERNLHVKTQHTNSPYMCAYCKDRPRFTTWELRKRHLMEFHNYRSGADIYECMTCHMTFKTRSQKYHHNVKAHRTKKESEYSYQCGSCARAFASKLSLDKHIAKKHFHV